jgi:adenosylhomocysteinase
VELDIPALEALAQKKRKIREQIQEYILENGNRIYLLGEGRLVNLACAEGHPASVMDMSFANQALTAEFIKTDGAKLENRVHPVPEHIDKEVARLKLESMNIQIDNLTPGQEDYLKSWKAGT